MGNQIMRFGAFLLASIVLVSASAGCSSKDRQPSVQDQKTVSENQTSPASGPEPLTLPIVSKPLTLSYFVEMDYNKIGVTTKSFADMTGYKEMEKKTGIKVNFIHPPAGQVKEQFNLMIASRDLPDMIYYGWMLNVPGGPQKMLDDGIIIKLNDLLDKYAPNMKAVMEKEPVIKRNIATDNGTLYDFPLIRINQNIKAFNGYQLRKDWLDKYSLKVPETIDEWYNVLKTFKEKDPAGGGKTVPFISYPITTPMSSAMGIREFAGAWGINYGFYQVDGKVKFGANEPEFKEFISTMRQWYKEGLIDPDFATTNNKQFDAKMTTGQAGSYYGGLGVNMARYILSTKDTIKGYELVPAVVPSTKKGTIGWNFMADLIYSGQGAAVTATSKYQKEAVKWLDYHYSPEGHMIMNFGVEGVSYKMADGKAKLMDDILNSPKGESVDVALGRHAQGASGEAQILDSGVREQRMWSMPVQREASALYNKGNATRMMPPTTPTKEESEKLASIVNEVNTYTDEMFNKYVLGQESIDSYNKFTERLKSMRIEEAIKIQQAALDRFNSRK